MQPLTSPMDATEDEERKAKMEEENNSTVINDLNHCKVSAAEDNNPPRPTSETHIVEDNLGASEVTKKLQTKLASSTSGKP